MLCQIKFMKMLIFNDDLSKQKDRKVHWSIIGKQACDTWYMILMKELTDVIYHLHNDNFHQHTLKSDLKIV